MKRNKNNFKRGFGFIDVLVGISLMTIIFLGIFGAYQLGMRVILQSKLRISATAIANLKLEMIRNLSYKEIGTTPHALNEPEGDILKNENVAQNNAEFAVETTITYINDCFDGPQSAECPQAPSTDSCPRDYKRAEVKVSWDKPVGGEIILATDIAPKNLNQEEEECTGEAAGVLSVTVFDAMGQAIEAPLIEVLDFVSGLVLTSAQPISGRNDFVFIPNSYRVRISKPGYSTTQTYNSGDSYDGRTIASPAKSHPVVYEGRLTEIGFGIDRLGSLDIETTGTLAQEYPLIGGAAFQMRGEKTVGNDAAGNPIYKYLENHTTDSEAGVNISGLEWDSYHFTVSSPYYELIGFEDPPESTTTQPIDLLPAENKEARLILKAENTFLATVEDATTSAPIFGAAVRLYNFGLGYDATQPTDENGQTLFLPLQADTYTITVQAEGYKNHSNTISVSGDETAIINLSQE